MNDTRWGMTSFLLLLGVASLIGASIVCAAGAPAALRDLSILDFMHLLSHLKQGLLLFSLASGCTIGALLCALVLNGSRAQPAIRAPEAWRVLWQVRWTPLDTRVFTGGLRLQEMDGQAEQPKAEGVVPDEPLDAVYAAGGGALSSSLAKRRYP